MSDPSVLLSAKQHRKDFPIKSVLKGVDLEVRRGQVVGLLGANAAGKTTLLKCLLGHLRPSGGTVDLLGEPSWDLSAEAKERLGYVPQEMLLLPWMSVANHVG
jgi:ABC-2 type transport system ATP-binding protein